MRRHRPEPPDELERAEASFVPKFTVDQRKQLRAVGVSTEQMARLRPVLVRIRETLRRPAARDDVADLLSEIESLASTLSRKLLSTALQVDSAHAAALRLIEPGYWRADFHGDSGPTAAHHLCPRLDTLASVAKTERARLPNKPTRHKKADPAPIGLIYDALLMGWLEQHRGEPFPSKLEPSISKTSPFYVVAGICYEAVGGGGDPERAIRTYRAAESAAKAEALSELDKALSDTSRNRRR